MDREDDTIIDRMLINLDSTLPTSVKNKPWLAAKMLLYAGFGFGLPFYAVRFHMYFCSFYFP